MNANRSAILVLCPLLACVSADRAAAAPPQAVLAEVDGEPITQADLDRGAGPSLAQLREQVYRLERQRLDLLIEERLLAREAARRGTSVDALLQAEVRARVVATKEEAEALLATRGGSAPATPAAVERTRARLQQERERDRRRAFVEELRGRARVSDRLQLPEPYRADLPSEGGRQRGPATAAVTIVEFSDFHCPFCRRVQPALDELRQRYGDALRVVYRDFPLDDAHPQARRAAEAARCAGEQGRFWEFHDALYGSGTDDASDAGLRPLAAQAKVDADRLVACIASGRQAAAVAADEQAGRALGVSRTPSFFVNGRPLTGAQSVESFARLIDDELARAKAGGAAAR